MTQEQAMGLLVDACVSFKRDGGWLMSDQNKVHKYERIIESYATLAFVPDVAELTRQRDALLKAAKAVVARWDTPNWKDAPHTGEFIHALRAAIADCENTPPA